LRSWWCDPDPLPTTSQPESAIKMCGASGVHNSSQVSEPKTVPRASMSAKPMGHDLCPHAAATSGGSAYSSKPLALFQTVKYLDSR